MDNTLKYNKPWILQRADPYVYKHTDGAYYFTASVPEYDRIVLRKSDTLAGLETADETEIWHKHESGPQSIHIWAPELHYLFGKWYIYYAGGDKDDIWAIRPYVLECQEMTLSMISGLRKVRCKEQTGMSFRLKHFHLMQQF